MDQAVKLKFQLQLIKRNSELVEENAQLKIDLGRAERISFDEPRRKEFAKAFNWREDKSMYSSTKELKLPTWTEIFVKIGALLATHDVEERLNEIDIKIGYFESAIEELRQSKTKE